MQANIAPGKLIPLARFARETNDDSVIVTAIEAARGSDAIHEFIREVLRPLTVAQRKVWLTRCAGLSTLWTPDVIGDIINSCGELSGHFMAEVIKVLDPNTYVDTFHHLELLGMLKRNTTES